jgi:nitrite reductase/ring-hydroxylating ferredoxin subunit
MDSGKVEHGPAKVPLKTYPIEVRGNRLYVKVPAPSRHAK